MRPLALLITPLVTTTFEGAGGYPGFPRDTGTPCDLPMAADGHRDQLFSVAHAPKWDFLGPKTPLRVSARFRVAVPGVVSVFPPAPVFLGSSCLFLFGRILNPNNRKQTRDGIMRQAADSSRPRRLFLDRTNRIDGCEGYPLIWNATMMYSVHTTRTKNCGKLW